MRLSFFLSVSSAAAVAAGLVVALFCTPVSAKVLGVVPIVGGGQILLHDDKGMCVGETTKRAEFVTPTGGFVIGCYRPMRGGFFAVFLDGDTATISIHSVQMPEDI